MYTILVSLENRDDIVKCQIGSIVDIRETVGKIRNKSKYPLKVILTVTDMTAEEYEHMSDTLHRQTNPTVHYNYYINTATILSDEVINNLTSSTGFMQIDCSMANIEVADA
jgi:hypothetical protein